MRLQKSTIITVFFTLIIVGPLFAQQVEQPITKNMQPSVIYPVRVEDSTFVTGADISLRAALLNQNHYIYWAWLNSKTFGTSVDRDLEKKQLRQQWQDLLGVDIFMPYFKVKEAQGYIENKTKVSLFNFKGKAYFNESTKQVEYIFKRKFQKL